MELSVFDLFKSHRAVVVAHRGPMRAAKFLCQKLRKHGLFERVAGSGRALRLARLDGRGHRTDRAIVWG